jgi:hypothetical protein
MVPDSGASPMMLAEAGRPLEIALAGEIDAALAGLREDLGKECLSDYAFSNLFLFRDAHTYRYLPGPHPCVAGVTYDGIRHLLPLFDLRSVALPVLSRLLVGRDCFYPVAAHVAAALDAQGFTLTASPDDADYLYPADNFRHYRGERLRKKRNLMQQLQDSCEVQALPLIPARLGDALAVLARWMEDKEKGAGEADEAACRNALQLSAQFGFDGTIYYADGEPIGFLVAQALSRTVAVMRFAKGVDARKGIYQYMFHHYCVSHPELAWVNFEQDLGLANFRQTKRSYQPCALLDKFRVAPK